MNYSAYYETDVVNGEGTRCVLFVSGCTHNCKGCYNKSAMNPNSGLPFTADLADKIIRDLKDTRIKRRGITLSGGDPMHSANLRDIAALCRRVKLECPSKDIWLYTGYTLEEMEGTARKDILRYVDVLIDGKFVEDLKDPSLKFRGSANQRIIHMETL